MAPKSTSSRGGAGKDRLKDSTSSDVDKDSEDYRLRRERNNVAVKKSREKSREKAKITLDKVNQLKQENADLEVKVNMLSKELSLLKDLLLTHAGGGRRAARNTTSPNMAAATSQQSLADPQTVQQDHEYSAAFQPEDKFFRPS